MTPNRSYELKAEVSEDMTREPWGQQARELFWVDLVGGDIELESEHLAEEHIKQRRALV